MFFFKHSITMKHFCFLFCFVFSQSYVQQQQKKLDAKKQDALRGVLEKALTQSFKPNEPQCIHTIKTYHGMPGKPFFRNQSFLISLR